MRYDTPIDFCRTTPGAYDARTGNYGAAAVVRDQVYADVNDTQAEMLQIIYGKIVQGSYTLRILGSYTEPFDYIEMDGKRYGVDFFRRFRRYEAFYVREVQ